MKKAIIFLLNQYQKISPAFWSTAGNVFLVSQCRFHPTCSEYCRQSLEKHPLPRALAASFWRVLRCQPFSRGGFDPA
ncbi:MAG: membrane protein insertion efficiency factor YidD [Candidatus Yanofskybacteria bacterium]|nr:membrane protein insertion efficiency factor YidD [Candidatus Yanofskybacteria bacterium]